MKITIYGEELLPELVQSLVFIVLAYFLGAIPTGYLIARARGVDIQKMGSGNIGATNVLRSVGVFACHHCGCHGPS